MKKFFSTLLVLVILAGTGLFFGWAQLGVAPDAYGIIRSKTHGVYPQLIIPGEFKWVWYKLIPTNTVTTVFRLNTVSRTFSASGALPSGKTYAAFAGLEDDFSWEMSADFSFNLRHTALFPLVSAHNINSQEELARHEQNIAGQIEAFILRRANTGASPLAVSSDLTFEALLKNGENPELEREIQEQFPDITHFSLNVKSTALPDFAMYRQIQGVYEDYISGELPDKAKSRVESYRQFDDLEQYGLLLTKYPILLDYLRMENSAR